MQDGMHYQIRKYFGALLLCMLTVPSTWSGGVCPVELRGVALGVKSGLSAKPAPEQRSLLPESQGQAAGGHLRSPAPRCSTGRDAPAPTRPEIR